MRGFTLWCCHCLYSSPSVKIEITVKSKILFWTAENIRKNCQYSPHPDVNTIRIYIHVHVYTSRASLLQNADYSCTELSISIPAPVYLTIPHTYTCKQTHLPYVDITVSIAKLHQCKCINTKHRLPLHQVTENPDSECKQSLTLQQITMLVRH